MSERNRIMVAAIALVAMVTLALPAPSHASGAGVGSWNPQTQPGKALSWIARLWAVVEEAVRSGGREKEGSAIGPDGRPVNSTTPPSGTSSIQASSPVLEGPK